MHDCSPSVHVAMRSLVGVAVESDSKRATSTLGDTAYSSAIRDYRELLGFLQYYNTAERTRPVGCLGPRDHNMVIFFADCYALPLDSAVAEANHNVQK